MVALVYGPSQILTWIYQWLNAALSGTGMFIVPLACIAAAIVFVIGRAIGWGRSGDWFALAIMGEAAGLHLIDAGNHIRYQHFLGPAQALSREHALFFGIFVLQASVVAAGLLCIWPEIRDSIQIRGHIRRWMAFALLFVLPGAALSRDPKFFSWELIFAACIHFVNLANIVLVLWHLPRRQVARLTTKWSATLHLLSQAAPGERPRLDRPAVMATLWVVAVTAPLSYFVYQAHPHVPDEVCYFLQAKYFAAGMIAMPQPAVPDAFELFCMQSAPGLWYSCFPPGWPAVLAIGFVAGLPWLVNPLLAGLCVLGIYKVVWHLYDRAIARASLLLICFSPWFLFMGMNLMAHTLTLACALGSALALLRARATESLKWGVPAGACIGLVALIRPYDGVVLALLVGLWVLCSRYRRRVQVLTMTAITAALVSSVIFPYNQKLTGSPVVFPVEDYFNKKFGAGTNSIGFGPNHGMSWDIDPLPGYSPTEAVINAALNIFSVNAELFGWMCGSLLLAAAAVVSGCLGRRDLPMIIVACAIPVGYALYWYSGGPDFGARYWYLIIVPLVVLSVRGLQWLAQSFAGKVADAGPRLMIGVLVLCALTAVNYLPWRSADKYYRFLEMAPDLREFARSRELAGTVVFVRGREHPDYASAAVYNTLTPGAAAPVFVWDRNPEVHRKVLSAFPRRAVMVLNGPTITGRGYEIAKTDIASSAAVLERGW